MSVNEWVRSFHQTRAEVPADLIDEIVACGYFPQLVLAAVERTLGGEPVLHHVVHHEVTFTTDNVHRHLTVLVLTPTRLVAAHTDDQTGPDGDPQAVASTESIGLSRINSVAMRQVVTHPEVYPMASSATIETWLTIGWGTVSQIDLQPASCGDPNCDADHGYQGTATCDDLTIRMSPAADGELAVSQLQDFGVALQQVTAMGR